MIYFYKLGGFLLCENKAMQLFFNKQINAVNLDYISNMLNRLVMYLLIKINMFS